MRDHDDLRTRLLADETRAFELPRSGRTRVAIGYPNSYHVAMSSLSFQWVTRLTVDATTDLTVERFFADPQLAGRSLESGSPLASFDLLAWTLSFEADSVGILQTLDAAGIPRRRSDRRGRGFPLLVVGGPVAVINPLPLAPTVDVFVLGAAERLWSALLSRIAAGVGRDRILDELAARDGFFVPEHHLANQLRPDLRLRRLDRHDQETAVAAAIPTSWSVTPNTEYRNRGLLEISRGCPEKCRYCWASYSSGRLRCYPTESILERLRELSRLTNRVGFIATAVGDHPDLGLILEKSLELQLQPAVSSLRIPAMRPEILRPLAQGGARSVTIAPEAGSSELRRSLGKPITNESILDAVEIAQACGLGSLKMYFILGLPGETDGDLEAIVELLRQTRAIMTAHGRGRGRLEDLRAGLSLLVPKPYTPYRREVMLDRREARRRIERVVHGARGIANLQIDRPSHRQAVWQGLLGRGDAGCFELIAEVADGQPLASVLRNHRALVDELCYRPIEGEPLSSFISSAPQPARR